ncbi:MAG: hypothetical protein ACRCYY_09730 [Trueperaceae bacterium]
MALIRTPFAQGVNATPGIPKVERLNHAGNGSMRSYEAVPDWSRHLRRSGKTPISSTVTTSSHLGTDTSVLLEKPVNPRVRIKRTEVVEELYVNTKATTSPGQPRMRGVNVLLRILAMLGCLHVMAMLGIELNRMVETQQEITRLSLETQVLGQEVAGLSSEIANANNPAFREQLARAAGFAYPEEARWLSVPSTDSGVSQP